MLSIITDATVSEYGAGISAVLYDSEKAKPMLVLGKKIDVTNIVEAELRGILYALEEIPQNGVSLSLQSDSKNAIKALNGDATFACSSIEKNLVRKIRKRIEDKALDVTFEWTPRVNNRVADAVAGIAARYGAPIAMRN